MGRVAPCHFLSGACCSLAEDTFLTHQHLHCLVYKAGVVTKCTPLEEGAPGERMPLELGGTGAPQASVLGCWGP